MRELKIDFHTLKNGLFSLHAVSTEQTKGTYSEHEEMFLKITSELIRSDIEPIL